MKLEVGKKYIDRGGREVDIVTRRISNVSAYPFVGSDKQNYAENGVR